MAREWTENRLGLKLLVGALTALLAAGLILLVVGLARTSGELGADDASVALAPAAFGELRVGLPAGHRLASLAADGGRLYLRTVGPEGAAQVLVLDGAEGRLLGRILLDPAK